MRATRQRQRLTVVVPVALGVAALVAAPWLLPGATELAGIDGRTNPAAPPVAPVATAPPLVEPPRASAVPIPPSLAAQIATADAATLDALTDRLIAEGGQVSSLGVAHDLVSAGRPAVALAYLAARPDGATPATWRLRFDLLRSTGDAAGALALLSAATRARTGVAPADIVAAAYALDRPDLIVQAARTGAIPPPDAALTLDLARRLEKRGAPAITALDRVTRTDWRAADPWLALRIARASGDNAAALRAAKLLPVKDRAAAEEDVLTRSGDRAGLVALLRRQAAQPGADRAALAERLLAAGDRAGALSTLQAAAATLPPNAPVAERLLYLMGPRPEAPALAWLVRRATTGPASTERAWLSVYADRDSPGAALALLTRHPLGDQTDILMARLRLARAADDAAAGNAALAALLDGRALTPADLRRIAASAPQRPTAALAATLARQRSDAGLVGAQERLDLAWRAWNRGDAAATVGVLRTYLNDRPNDVVALRLMGDAQVKLSGEAAARPWFARALVQTGTPSRAGAELLEKLGRRGDAIRMVEDLRTETPRDRSLVALHARLLIAHGQPGRAREVLSR